MGRGIIAITQEAAIQHTKFHLSHKRLSESLLVSTMAVLTWVWETDPI